MFDNRLGLDVAYYKTNTRNQILTLPTSSETGVSNRIINAGDIQNQGVELLLKGTLIRNRNFLWDVAVNYTVNRNKIIDLYPGVTQYRLQGGSDVESWATAGGAYGDLYSPYAYLRNADGVPLLNAGGQFLRSQTQELVGNSLPKFLGGFTTDVSWKGFTFSAVIDGRFGGQIWSGSYNYGMSSGSLKSSLTGRTTEYGGLERTLADGRVVYDGMLPDGVFQAGSVNSDGVDLSGMTYKDAYKQGLVKPLAAGVYYDNLYNWGRGIREAAILDISWVALRELALYWDIPKKWKDNSFVKGATIGLAMRNVGYLYNSLPDHIHPEGLKSNLSAEFTESGGNVYSRNYSLKINLNF
jgi:iron complex outermembrane receptor protein